MYSHSQAFLPLVFDRLQYARTELLTFINCLCILQAIKNWRREGLGMRLFRMCIPLLHAANPPHLVFFLPPAHLYIRNGTTLSFKFRCHMTTKSSDSTSWEGMEYSPPDCMKITRSHSSEHLNTSSPFFPSPSLLYLYP